MKILTKIGYVMMIVLVVSIGCRKFVELGPPTTQLVSSTVYSSDATATAAISNIYLLCASGNFASGTINSVTMLCGLSADELDLYSTETGLNQISKNNILPDNAGVYGLWVGAYSTIYKCNLMIEGLSKSTSISQSVRDQLLGEVLFMRAFTHFYLAGIFGDIPYVTGTDYRINTAVKQTEYTEVIKLIIEDLVRAKSLLASDYSFVNSERIRPSKWAATALLARAYLYANDWINAERASTEVIEQHGLYDLIDLEKVFLKNSKETIWQIKPVSTTANTNEGAIFILVAKPVGVTLRTGFVDGFENSDLRKQAWTGTFSNSDGTWDFAHKYRVRSGASPLNEYSMVLRLAEQYLIRAESRAKQGKLGEAINDIDEIRARAGLLKISESNPTISKNDLLLAIEQERKVELFAEWGHRWFDLKRTGRIDQVLSAQKIGWTPSAALFPIPAAEIKVNQNLIQNGGYQK